MKYVLKILIKEIKSDSNPRHLTWGQIHRYFQKCSKSITTNARGENTILSISLAFPIESPFWNIPELYMEDCTNRPPE